MPSRCQNPKHFVDQFVLCFALARALDESHDPLPDRFVPGTNPLILSTSPVFPEPILVGIEASVDFVPSISAPKELDARSGFSPVPVVPRFSVPYGREFVLVCAIGFFKPGIGPS
jgi:hypothetical protein